MSSKISKWTNERNIQNPEDPLRVVFFVSRKKDNKDVQGFHQRRVRYYVRSYQSPYSVT